MHKKKQRDSSLPPAATLEVHNKFVKPNELSLEMLVLQPLNTRNKQNSPSNQIINQQQHQLQINNMK